MKLLLLSVVSMWVLSGCNTFRGMGEDIQKGGAAIEKAANK
jgi:predicted small secreted protein